VAVVPFSNLQGSNFKSCKLPFFLSPCRYLSDIIMSPQVFVKKMSLLDPFFYLNDQRKLEYNYMISLIFRKRIWISFPTWFCQGNFGLYVSVYTFHQFYFTNFVDRVPYFLKQNRALQFCGPSPINLSLRILDI